MAWVTVVHHVQLPDDVDLASWSTEMNISMCSRIANRELRKALDVAQLTPKAMYVEYHDGRLNVGE